MPGYEDFYTPLSPDPSMGRGFGGGGFFIPSGMSTGGTGSPVGSAIQSQFGGGMTGGGGGGPQMSPWGGYATNYNFPGGGQGTPTPSGPSGFYSQQMPSGGMDPRYFQYMMQSGLMGQQYQQRQSGVGEAIKRIIPTLQSLGIPTSPADVSKQMEQQVALESAPIMQNMQAVEREIEEDAARRGASLGSDRERRLSETRGTAAGALRQRQVGAPLEYALKLLQMMPSMVSGLGG
jgi:hypothetical protein